MRSDILDYYFEVERFDRIDDGSTKEFMMENRDAEGVSYLFRLAFEKRPAEELYDLEKDTAQIHNLTESPEYADVRQRLRAELEQRMIEVNDPHAFGKGRFWDEIPYYGRRS